MESDSKKIIIVGPAYPYRGGIASYSERLARQFTVEGHDVQIYTFTLQYPNFLFPGKTQYSEDEPPSDIVIQRKINSVNPLNWIKVGNEIKKAKADLLILNYWLPFMGPCFGTLARRAKKNKVTKVIGILHNVIPHEKRAGDKQFTRYMLKPIDGFITMAKSVENDLLLFDKIKQRDFNPHPLYDNFGTAISRSEALELLHLDDHYRYILFFGIIRDYKGLDLLLEAFSKMDRSGLNVRLLVAGEYYSDEEKYQKLIHELGIGNDVVVVNQYIKDAEVARYFCAADIIAQPYKTATQSGVTQIGYHFEIPMLVTNVGGLAEIVPDGKVGYVTTQSTDEIAAALTQFFKESKAAEFKANIQIEKEKYSWDKLTQKIIQLIK